MEIIIELSLCINCILNAFIIRSTALFLKEKTRLWWLSAGLGAGVAVALPLFHLPAILHILVTALLAALLVSISFSFKTFKRFLLIYGSFLGVTFIYGGGCYALEQSVGELPLLCVLICASVIYIFATIILKIRNKARTVETFLYKIKLSSNGKTIEEEGYLDSGNMLYDPITKKPIILITFDVFTKFYEGIDYLNAYLKNVDTTLVTNGHYVKINSVASGSSILVFTADRLEIETNEHRRFDNISVGLSFSGFDKALGRKILLHSELI